MGIKEVEMDLFNKYKAGDKKAKTLLIKSMDPLIYNSVSKFTNSGLPEIALKLEAKGLVSKAIDTYNPSMGTQLNTHATNYLKKLSRFTTTYQNVGYIPEPRALLIGKYNNIYANLESELGREPTAIELSDAMDVPLGEIDKLQTELRNDLSTSIVADDDTTGFYNHIDLEQADPKIKQAIDFVYFDSDPIDRKILEGILGIYGATIKKSNVLAKSLNISDAELKSRKIALSLKIKKLL